MRDRTIKWHGGFADPPHRRRAAGATAEDPEAFAVFYRRHVRGGCRLPPPGRRPELARPDRRDVRRRPGGGSPLRAAARARPRLAVGIAWSSFPAQRRGRPRETSRRALGMSPITLTDGGVARTEHLRWRAPAAVARVAARRAAGATQPATDPASNRGRVCERRPDLRLQPELLTAGRRRTRARPQPGDRRPERVRVCFTARSPCRR